MQSKMTKQYIKTNNLALLSFKKVDIAQNVFPRVLTWYLRVVRHVALNVPEN